MSKTFLIELTEKELHAVKIASLNHQLDITNGPLLPTEKERVVKNINGVIAKLEVASNPREEVLITDKDLFLLVDMAIKEYKLLPQDPHLSHKLVAEGDLKHICLANSVIMWLNNKKLLKSLVKFDMTDNSCQYEETEE